MREYLVIYEQAKDGGWERYVPDLPGQGVAAETCEEAATLIREGMEVYLEELREDGAPVPEPANFAENLAVAA